MICGTTFQKLGVYAFSFNNKATQKIVSAHSLELQHLVPNESYNMHQYLL